MKQIKLLYFFKRLTQKFTLKTYFTSMLKTSRNKYFQKSLDLIFGLLVLFIFQYIGVLLQQILALRIPGVILGMLLFFIFLMVLGKVPRFLTSCTDTLLPLLPLFILPSFVGILAHKSLLTADALPLFIAITLGLIFTQLLTPIVFLFFLKIQNPKDNECL